MEYKWIKFAEQVPFPGQKTKRFNCYNKEHESLIGEVRWYGGFRKYSFFPASNIVFENQCLKDIASFLEKLMLERKIEKQQQ